MSTLDEIRARDDEWAITFEGDFDALKICPHEAGVLVWPREWAVHDRRTLLALLDAQSLELSVVVGQRDYATKSNAANYDRADKAEKELQAVREALELQVMAAFRELDGHTLFESYDLLRQRIDVLREALAALQQSRGA